MIYNGIEKDYIRVTRELFRPPTAPVDFLTHAHSRGGERVRKKRFTGMELPIPITIKSDRKVEELKEELSNWLVHAEAKQLIFKDTPNRYYLAEYQSMDLAEYHRYAKGVIVFYLPEAYRFGDSKHLIVGTSFANHSVTGQVETTWKSRTVFSGSTNQFVLENDQGGKVICNFGFKSNDILEIDYKKRKITLNGEARPELLIIQSHWFELTPGVNRLRASEPTTIEYVERYH